MKYKLTYYPAWDIESGKKVEHWSLWEFRRGLISRKEKWRPVMVHTYASLAGGGREQAHGNKDWATQTAKHYGIEMPWRSGTDGKEIR
jgi:hypothetical protein